MRTLAYIRYFMYLALNWNLRIAWFITREEIRGERKYGIRTTGADTLKKTGAKGIDTSHATIYMPVSYSLLDEAFEILNKTNGKPLNHFLDIGCGKGRALCVAAHRGFKKVTGIDLAKELCEDARKNLALTWKRIPAFEYQVINNDAYYYSIDKTVDCIFLFNPFDGFILSGVVRNILQSHSENPRTITIVYVNPVHREQFIKAGYKEVYHDKRMKYLELSVLSN